MDEDWRDRELTPKLLQWMLQTYVTHLRKKRSEHLKTREDKRNIYAQAILREGAHWDGMIENGMSSCDVEDIHQVELRIKYSKKDYNVTVISRPTPRKVEEALIELEKEAIDYTGDLKDIPFPKPVRRTFTEDVSEYSTLTRYYFQKRLESLEALLADQPGITEWAAHATLDTCTDAVVDSNGYCVVQEQPKGMVHIYATAKRPGKEDKLEDSKSVGFFGSYDQFARAFRDARKLVPELARNVVKHANAPIQFDDGEGNKMRVKSGQYPVVLSAQVMADVLHESLIHPIEATHEAEDSFNSVFEDPTDDYKKFITVFDDPRMKINGFRPPSFFRFDHEGFKASRKYILRKGKVEQKYFASYIDACKADKELNIVPTGNSRVGDLTEKDEDGEIEAVTPSARQSTIYLAPGKYSLEEMLKEVAGKGYYLDTSSEGESDEGRGYVKIATLYWVTKDLKLVPVGIPKGTEIYIDKDIYSFLEDLEMLGNKIEWQYAYCGDVSGLVPLTQGAPAGYVSRMKLDVRRAVRHHNEKPLVPFPKRAKYPK